MEAPPAPASFPERKFDTPSLTFESRFECGNLHKVIRIDESEYDLMTSPDINSLGHTQWFFFKVGGMVKGQKYKFNFLNFEKNGTSFSKGMKPVMYSRKLSEEAEADPYFDGLADSPKAVVAEGEAKDQVDTYPVRHGWHRADRVENITYYPNFHTRTNIRPSELSADGSVPSYKETFWTLTMTLEFPRTDDDVYLAYHYPLSVTTLRTYLNEKSADPSTANILRRQPLTRTRYVLCSVVYFFILLLSSLSDSPLYPL